MKYRRAKMLLIAVCGLISGCDKDHGLPLVAVRGQVIFEGGSPPTDGNLTFVQVGDSGQLGVPNRPGRATFGTDGKFQATTFEQGDGLLPGRYQVTITCVSAEAQPGQPFDDVSFVPADYRPDQLVVEQDSGPIEVSYDVPLNPKKK